MHSQALGRWRTDVCIVIACALALLAVMCPVLRRTYQISLTLRCGRQLEQIFQAVRSYAEGHGGYPPCQDVPPAPGSAGNWREQMRRRLSRGGAEDSAGPWECPAGGTYVGNRALFGPPHRTLGSFRLRREIGIIADGKAAVDGPGVGDFRGIDWRHRGGANVMYLDGHVDWVPEDKAAWAARHWDDPR